ncbi:MAG: hypothetical protein ABI629_25825 [bacterium]
MTASAEGSSGGTSTSVKIHQSSGYTSSPPGWDDGQRAEVFQFEEFGAGVDLDARAAVGVGGAQLVREALEVERAVDEICGPALRAVDADFALVVAPPSLAGGCRAHAGVIDLQQAIAEAVARVRHGGVAPQDQLARRIEGVERADVERHQGAAAGAHHRQAPGGVGERRVADVAYARAHVQARRVGRGFDLDDLLDAGGGLRRTADAQRAAVDDLGAAGRVVRHVRRGAHLRRDPQAPAAAENPFRLAVPAGFGIAHVKQVGAAGGAQIDDARANGRDDARLEPAVGEAERVRPAAVVLARHRHRRDAFRTLCGAAEQRQQRDHLHPSHGCGDYHPRSHAVQLCDAAWRMLPLALAAVL